MTLKAYIKSPKEPVIVPGQINLPYKYAVGATGSKFLTELRDNKRLLGIKCPECNRVYMPPRSTCGYCFSTLNDWVEVSPQGTVTSYTVAYYSEPVQPYQPPCVYALIQLDGADTGLPHIVGEVDFEKLKIGMRVEAVFKDKREGTILDIKYFKPI